MTDCIFCKIVKGDIPSYKVYEDEHTFAFLDLSQVSKGHTLVIPKKHVSNVFEFEDEQAAHVLGTLPKIARAVRAFDPAIEGLNVLSNNGTIASQTVFHSHFHLIPRYEEQSIDGFGLKWETHSENYQPEDLSAMAEKIQSNVEG